MNYIKNLAEYIAKNQLHTEIKCRLGAGSKGTAFLLKDGNVLKITEQMSEYYMSTSIVGRYIPHINEIYKTFKIIDKDITMYGIYQAHVDTSIKKDLEYMREEMLDCPFYMFHNYIECKGEFTPYYLKQYIKSKNYPQFEGLLNQLKKVAEASFPSTPR